ncbi:MAG: invasion associated locus B family protein [Methylocella sp.]
MRSLIASLLLSVAWSAAGQAQTPAPQAVQQAAPGAPAPAAPASRKKLFDYWVLVCATPPGSAEETCEVDATLQPEAQLPPVAKVAFVRDAKSQTVRLVAIIQANLKIEPGVEVAADPEKAGVILGFRSCLNSACLADAVLSADELQHFRSSTRQGRLTIKNAAGEELSLKIPRHGLDEALDALLTQQGQ